MAEFTRITHLVFLLTWEHHGKAYYSLYVLMYLNLDENMQFFSIYFVIKKWQSFSVSGCMEFPKRIHLLQ